MIQEISLQLFTYCNLDCSYCYIEKDYRKKVRIFDKYNDLIRVISSLELDDNLNIILCGNEPSLYCNDIFDIYKKLKKIERNINSKIEFGLYTNGTNLEGIINLLDKGVLSSEVTNFSWDGIKSSITRKSINISFNDKFFNDKVKLLGNSKFRDKLLVRTSIHPDIIDHLYDSVLFLLENGCTKWEYYFLTDCEDYRDINFINKFKEQLEKISILYTKYRFDYYNRTNFINSRYSKKRYKSIGCNIGHTLGISIDGVIYPCGFFTNGCKYCDNNYIIGDIYTGLDKNKLDNFVNEYTNQQDMCNFYECSNKQCVECLHPIKYRPGKDIKYKSTQVCLLRDAETEIFIRSWL